MVLLLPWENSAQLSQQYGKFLETMIYNIKVIRIKINFTFFQDNQHQQ